MCAQNSEISIYVACLAAYNNGYLHGVWIDADQSAEDIHKEIAEMLALSPIPDAEEWAIHDYEGFFQGAVSEYSGIDEVAALASFISEHGELGGLVLEYFGDIETATEALEDRYCGEYRSAADYAEELTAQTGDVPEYLSFYIDYERMSRDLELGGDILTFETGMECVHVFHGG